VSVDRRSSCTVFRHVDAASQDVADTGVVVPGAAAVAVGVMGD